MNERTQWLYNTILSQMQSMSFDDRSELLSEYQEVMLKLQSKLAEDVREYKKIEKERKANELVKCEHCGKLLCRKEWNYSFDTGLGHKVYTCPNCFYSRLTL